MPTPHRRSRRCGGMALRQGRAAGIDTPMKRSAYSWGIAICLALSGCTQHEPPFVQHTTSNPPLEPAVDAKGNPLSRAELLPDGRWVKKVDIRSQPWGSRIMVAGFYMGETPMQVTIPCTPSGRFRRTTEIRLIPTEAGGRVHTEIFRAGARVPSRLSFSDRYTSD